MDVMKKSRGRPMKVKMPKYAKPHVQGYTEEELSRHKQPATLKKLFREMLPQMDDLEFDAEFDGFKRKSQIAEFIQRALALEGVPALEVTYPPSAIKKVQENPLHARRDDFSNVFGDHTAFAGAHMRPLRPGERGGGGGHAPHEQPGFGDLYDAENEIIRGGTDEDDADDEGDFN